MIRAASPADIPRLVELGTRFMRESGYARHLTVNGEAMAALKTTPLAKLAVSVPQELL